MSNLERFKNYDKPHCWQYEVKLSNLKDDLSNLAFNPEAVSLDNLSFKCINKEDKFGCYVVKCFIEKNEWLGKMPARPTHRFISAYNGDVTSAIVMATPNTFSNILGKENKDLEKLIARGASASWAPKNIGSWTIMRAIDWMVDNTPFRIFTGYGDPEAKELGTIYQACNFYYLGQQSGTQKLYYDERKPWLGWFNDRNFRHQSNYRKYGRDIGFEIPFKKYAPNWEIIPGEIKKKLKERERAYRDSCLSRESPRKHKYVYIKGETPKETRELRKLFLKMNEIHPYPTKR